ncbi:MAG: class I SAM-dependent methyltransferase [Caulobacteraceae bacterium]
MNQPSAKKLFGLQDDAQWLDIVIESITTPIINDIHMPRFPHASIQDRWVGSHDEQALREAYNFYSHVKRQAEAANAPLTETSRFLDFGVGWARYPRFFWYDIPAEGLHGVDINSDVISACAMLGAPGTYKLIDPQGSLPYEDNFFDCTIAYSVFTHLPEALCEHWMAELSRVTRPGGIVVYTVEPPRFLDFIATTDAGSDSEWYRLLSAFKNDVPEFKRRAENGEVVYVKTLGDHNPISEFYGDTVVPRSFIEGRWGSYFDLVEYIDDPALFWQAVVTVRKLGLIEQAPQESGLVSAQDKSAKAIFNLQNEGQWLDLLIRSVNEPFVAGVDMPRFPHRSIQERWVGSHDAVALQEAYIFYARVKGYAEALGVPLHEHTQFLDFGVGWGRYPRVFWYDIAASGLHGVDIDADAVSSCMMLGVPGTYELIDARGRLPYEDGQFDCIIAYSVFTHLPQHIAEHWMSELCRVTRQNGIVAFTVEPPRFLDFIEAIGPEPESNWHAGLAKFKELIPEMKICAAQGELCYIPTGGGGEFMTPEVYGDTVIPRKFIEVEWAKYFRLVDYIDDPSAFWQAAVIVQKP